MPKLSVAYSHSVEVYPRQLAEMFLDCDEGQQAEFFSAIADLTKCWKTPFCFQLHSVCDSDMLTPEGRAIMVEIGEYAAQEV
jgi:hypothetical protein